MRVCGLDQIGINEFVEFPVNQETLSPPDVALYLASYTQLLLLATKWREATRGEAVE